MVWCQVATAIVDHEGSAKAARVTWEEDTYHESVFARDLEQLNTGKKVSPDPKTWIDEETGEQSDSRDFPCGAFLINEFEMAYYSCLFNGLVVQLTHLKALFSAHLVCSVGGILWSSRTKVPPEHPKSVNSSVASSTRYLG